MYFLPRNKLQAKAKEAEEELDALKNKHSSLEKTKKRIDAELEDLNLNLENVRLRT